MHKALKTSEIFNTGLSIISNAILFKKAYGYSAIQLKGNSLLKEELKECLALITLIFIVISGIIRETIGLHG